MGVIHEKNTKESCKNSMQRERKKKEKNRVVEIHEKGELQEEHAKTEERNKNTSNP
jgi:hypothetical protein